MKIGDLVNVTAIVVKKKTYENCRYQTEFVIEPCGDFLGIYIGYRTAQTGYTINDWEDGPIFNARGKFKYLLVVTSDRKNPIKASPAHTTTA